MGPRLRQVDGATCGGPPGSVPWTVNSPPLRLSARAPCSDRVLCNPDAAEAGLEVYVFVAALHAGGTVIVTASRSDFPAAAVDPFGVEADGPDRFVSRLVAQDWEGLMEF